MSTEADHARSAADAAAEAIRAINHATRHFTEFAVGDVYAITGSLAITQSRLEQPSRQLAAILRYRVEHGTLRHDADTDVNTPITRAIADLAEAGALASLASRMLDNAQQQLAAIADASGW